MKFISTDSSIWCPPAKLHYREVVESMTREEGEEDEEGEVEEEKVEKAVDEKEEKKENDIETISEVNSTPVDPGLQIPLFMCGVDCEMCYTELGLELTRVIISSLLQE